MIYVASDDLQLPTLLLASQVLRFELCDAMCGLHNTEHWTQGSVNTRQAFCGLKHMPSPECHFSKMSSICTWHRSFLCSPTKAVSMSCFRWTMLQWLEACGCLYWLWTDSLGCIDRDGGAYGVHILENPHDQHPALSISCLLVGGIITGVKWHLIVAVAFISTNTS